MKGWPLIFLYGALTITTPSAAAIIESNVLSTLGWQSTGMSVKRGTNYGVWQTSGTWTVDYRNFKYVDAAGYSPKTDAMIYQGCKYNGSWPYGLLLGRIGGTVFPIGRGISFVAPQDGLLELSIHDNSSCLLDNAGSLHVKVEDGVDERGLLGRITDSLTNTLTPAERERLSLVVRDIAPWLW